MPLALSEELDLGDAPGALSIGLVNNMPGEAARSTKRQFSSLLVAGAGRRVISLRCFTITGDGCESRGDLDELANCRLDALIVTGMPPTAAKLTDEPCWAQFTRLIDLARDRAIPTIWSCLAAHAAVLHLDGIERRALPRKLSGLANCARVEPSHPITAGLPARWRVPHSRYNDVPEAALAACGYRILARSPEAGADMFFKDAGAPFLFLQGHPEYEAHTLLKEYGRDVGAFLAGLRVLYPAMPSNYLAPHAVALLDRYREHTSEAQAPGSMMTFPWAECQEGLAAPWRVMAVSLWTNWLAGIVARRNARGSCRDTEAAPYTPLDGPTPVLLP